MNPVRIRVLDDQTINKIAAGEVIENPASVVKELVENSLDAGASSICVEIQEGGRQLIRITDDGCGMSQDDALLSLERHATSKIREVEDIEALITMGFRGEAIPSIASISKFSLLTCPRSDNPSQAGKGTLVLVDGGRLISCSQAARSPGTTMEVKSLFFNVPVRRKFQKSPASDSQEILKMLGLLALGHPTVQFELISDQKNLLKTTIPRTENPPFQELLGKRIEAVLGAEYTSSLMPLKFNNGPYELEGYIGIPSSHKPNRTGQHLFINQRSVYSPLIAAAIREGYGTMLPTQRYPLFVLHLRMPGSLVDVNVHPQKKEVRLRQEYQLKEMIIQGVQTALRREQGSREPLPSKEPEAPPPPYWAPKGSFFLPPKTAEEPWEYQKTTPSPIYRAKEEGTPFSYHSATPCEAPKPSPLPYPTLLNACESSLTPPRVIASLVGYCLLDPFHLPPKLFNEGAEKKEGGLALVDQRAAHRRIHYESFLKRNSAHESQSLLIPFTFQTTPSDFRVVQEHLSTLNQMGFGMREFGENAFMVDAYPHFLKQDQLQNCLTLLIQDLAEMQTSRRLQIRKEEQLALAACRASLPAARQLSLEEAQGLVKQLMECEIPSQCPIGRATCLYLSPDELAKWFQKNSS